MTDLHLLFVIVLLGFVFLSWQLDRILTAIKRSGYDADATGYLADISDEVDAIRRHIAPKPTKTS